MKIAVYHGFEKIHHEMLGYLIDYFLYSPITVDWYAHESKSSVEWFAIYKDIFKKDIKWLSPFTFDEKKYDLIILLTDDDTLFDTIHPNGYDKSKIISINHSNINKRNEVFDCIQTRFTTKFPNRKWALPCYRAINLQTKKELLDKNQRLSVVCIGLNNVPASPIILKNLFINFDDIDFHVVSRIIKGSYICNGIRDDGSYGMVGLKLFDNLDGHSNIMTYEMCSTDKIIELLKSANYVLCLYNPFNTGYINSSITASIPLAFNYLCKLLIPSVWQEHYNFKSCISYTDTDKILLGNTINDLHSIEKEQVDLVSHRNTTLDNAIRQKIPTLHNSLLETNKDESWFIKLNIVLQFDKINTFINIGLPNDNNQVIKYFRDIRNFLDIGNETYSIPKDRHITNYNISELKNTIFKVNEPVIFNINVNHETLLNVIPLLGNRSHKDVILINNIQTIQDLNLIRHLYDRYSARFSCEDPNILVMISQ